MVDVEGGLERMSLDSARSLDFHLQQIEQLEQAEQQQRAAAAAAAAPPGEGRLRKLAVAVLGASSPSLVDAIDRVTAGPAPSPAGSRGPYNQVVLENIFNFLLAPHLHRGSQGKVRTVIFSVGHRRVLGRFRPGCGG